MGWQPGGYTTSRSPEPSRNAARRAESRSGHQLFLRHAQRRPNPSISTGRRERGQQPSTETAATPRRVHASKPRTSNCSGGTHIVAARSGRREKHRPTAAPVPAAAVSRIALRRPKPRSRCPQRRGPPLPTTVNSQLAGCVRQRSSGHVPLFVPRFIGRAPDISLRKPANPAPKRRALPRVKSGHGGSDD